MAAPTAASRPGRMLGTLTLAILAIYATMFLTDNLTPKLALDLRGGTQVTLRAKPLAGRGQVNNTTLSTAVEIIQKRVNGFGVSEAEVAVQGRDTIVVSIPGENQQQTAEKVGQTALLTFRPVLLDGSVNVPPVSPPAPSAKPSETGKPSETAKPSETGKPGATPTKQGRPVSTGLLAAPSPAKTGSASAAPSVPVSPPGVPGLPEAAQNPDQMANPDQIAKELSAAGVPEADAKQVAADFVTLDCTHTDVLRDKLNAIPDDKPIATCAQKSEEGTKYILGKVAVKGEEISSADARPPGQNNLAWVVDLSFRPVGTKQFGDITRAAVTQQPPRNQVAIVLDGFVISSPQITTPITAGNAQIEGGGGGFSQAEASDLTNVLKYGALPVAFEKDEVTQVSATLGSDQMTAGLIAGAVGLLLVVIYSMIYYRGLALVTVLSLIVASLLTYAVAVLLGPAMGFTLSLPGIAGLIVAIGITADSFVVFFERLRDEVRDGRSLRSAVEHGWTRARRTIITADMVSIFAAAALYTLSTGSVRGFAFTLGLTTVIDLLVVFLFTKPLMTYLARTRFFGDGHTFSGLDPKHLGARPRPKTAPIATRRRVAGKEA